MFLAIKTEILLNSALNKAVYAFISYHNHILDNHIHSGSVSVWILKIQSYWGKRVKKKIHLLVKTRNLWTDLFTFT